MKARLVAVCVTTAIAGLVALAPVPRSVHAQAPPLAIGANAIHLLIDTSGSMADADPTGRIKMEGAKAAMLEFLDGAQLGTAIGLRTYPDPSASGCNTGSLRFDIDRHDPADVSAVIRGLQPSGDTPTAEALEAAAADVRRSGFPSATLVLVSDGESTCADPCETASQIVASGIEIEVITVGFRISDAGAEELQCIASVTGGRYIDIDDSDQLEQVLRDVSVPRLELSVNSPESVVAEVGTGRDGVVVVTADLTNVGQATAVNVRIWIQFESASPGVIAPVRTLGNIAPATSANQTSWTFRPGLLTAGTSIDFAVVVRADNMPTDLGQDALVSVLDPVNEREAGDVLRDGRLAIMGDSYSAGEGSDEYLAGTDSNENSCHRSSLTYAVPTFEIPSNAIFACSGAVTAQIAGRDVANGLPSQVDQLDAAQRSGQPFDAVLITIGGNDAGFRKLAEGCFLGDCDVEIDGQSAQAFRDAALADLEDSLVLTYREIHATLNDPDMVERRGRVAPIIVLGYPRPVPTVDRDCSGLATLEFAGVEFDPFSAGEITFVQDFMTHLNGIVEGAVEAARQLDERVPVFFVPNVEDSFLPDHTVCDRVPYARGVDSFNGAAVDLNVSLGDFFRALNPFQTFVSRMKFLAGEVKEAVLERSIQELMHPNVLGYEAMTRALIRWSTSPGADDIAQFVRTVPTAEPRASCASDSEVVDLASLSAGELLEQCLPYRLTVSGFAPGTSIELEVRSSPRTLGVFRAGNDGTVVAAFELPVSLDPGPHALRFVGIGEDGRHRDFEVAFALAGPDEGAPGMLALGGVSMIGVGVLLGVFGRRQRQSRPNGGTAGGQAGPAL